MKYMLVLFFLLGCAQYQQELSNKVIYKNDMQIELDGVKYNGNAVIPLKTEYKFTFKSISKMDMLIFTSCHRDVNIENAGGHFSPKEADFIYRPIYPIETRYCPIKIAAINQEGKNTFGQMDIIDSSVSLPAKLTCNGDKSMVNGASFCESLYGLKQMIEFPVEVVISGNNKRCTELVSGDKKQFIFDISMGDCVYNIMEILPPNREHRLTTKGYQQIILRELP